MSHVDRDHWESRYVEAGPAPVIVPPPPPPLFADVVDLFPNSGTALESACGRGRAAVWLASLGMSYIGVDVSPTAVALAHDLADRSGVSERCRFAVFDLDDGLPPGNPVDLVLSYLFLDRRLARPMMSRLAPGGVLAIATLSEVDAGPGDYRAAPGELPRLFGALDILAGGKADGFAFLLGRGRTRQG